MSIKIFWIWSICIISKIFFINLKEWKNNHIDINTRTEHMSNKVIKRLSQMGKNNVKRTEALKSTSKKKGKAH